MKPILFNTNMVRAILDGRKTVTRRVVKPQPVRIARKYVEYEGMFYPCHLTMPWESRPLDDPSKPPYQPGDILYVRETWNGDWCDHYIYKADSGSAIAAGYGKEPKWHPSIHMPKDAARIFLRVTSVRVERLQDCGCAQAKDEGCTCCSQFARLWDETIKPAELALYGWTANPWVWVIGFERCEKPEVNP